MVIGKKGRDFALRYGLSMIAELSGLGDAPELIDTLAASTTVIDGFTNERFDEVHVVYTKFINTMSQREERRRLLPVEPPQEAAGDRVEYTYEPGEQAVLNELLPRFVEVQLYQMVLEAIVSEHAARMVAMRNATDNANELVDDLTLEANKARQESITKEVTEIAAASMR